MKFPSDIAGDRPDPVGTRTSWKERALKTSLWMTATMATTAWSAAFWEVGLRLLQPMMVPSLIAIVGVWAAVLIPRLPVAFRVTALTTYFVIETGLRLLTMGPTVGMAVHATLFVVILALLGGVRGLCGAVALMVVMYVVAAAGWTHGWLPVRLAIASLDPTDTGTWIRVGITILAGLGTISYLIVYLIDDFNRANRELREIFDHTTDIIFLVCLESDGRLVYERVNRAGIRVGGLKSSADVVGKTAAQLFGPATGAIFEADYRACIAAGRSVTIEQNVAMPSGQTVFHATLVPIPDDDGQVVRLAGFVHDITLERRQQALLEQTQQIARVGGWEIDCVTKEMSWTRQAYTIYDVTPATFTPTTSTVLEFFQGKDREQLEAAAERALRDGLGYDLTLQAHTPAGRDVPVRTLCRVDSRDGRPVRVCGAVLDLTDLARAEQEVRRLNTELEQRVVDRTVQLAAANAELEAFSYSVSHDLRAPLRSLDGFSSALDEDYGAKLDETGRDYVHRIRAASQRMGHLIDDLLALSRLSRSEMKREPIDLSALAGEIVAELRSHEPERVVAFECAPGLIARADRNLVRAALQNLLSNAWKYTRRQPVARITFDRRPADNGHPAALCVADNGAGFDMRYAGKLFGAFQRLHSAAEFEGTGVGLATVRRIVNRHGGRIWVDAAPEKGARFYFTFEESPA